MVDGLDQGTSITRGGALTVIFLKDDVRADRFLHAAFVHQTPH